MGVCASEVEQVEFQTPTKAQAPERRDDSGQGAKPRSTAKPGAPLGGAPGPPRPGPIETADKKMILRPKPKDGAASARGRSQSEWPTQPRPDNHIFSPMNPRALPCTGPFWVYFGYYCVCYFVCVFWGIFPDGFARLDRQTFLQCAMQLLPRAPAPPTPLSNARQHFAFYQENRKKTLRPYKVARWDRALCCLQQSRCHLKPRSIEDFAN